MTQCIKYMSRTWINSCLYSQLIESYSRLHSTVTLLCNDEILELPSTPVSSHVSSHVASCEGTGDNGEEEEEEEGPQPWSSQDGGGSDIPVAVGIFVATVVGTPVIKYSLIINFSWAKWPQFYYLTIRLYYFTHGQLKLNKLNQVFFAAGIKLGMFAGMAGGAMGYTTGKMFADHE